MAKSHLGTLKPTHPAGLGGRKPGGVIPGSVVCACGRNSPLNSLRWRLGAQSGVSLLSIWVDLGLGSAVKLVSPKGRWFHRVGGVSLPADKWLRGLTIPRNLPNLTHGTLSSRGLTPCGNRA